MGVIETKVFEAGDDGAVRLPRELGFPPGTAITIRTTPFGLSIRPAKDAGAALRNNRALVEELRAIWADTGPPPREERDPDIFPDRPGLY